MPDEDELYEAISMLSMFIIILKSSYGIMGWRRQILVSTLLSFLITILVFELVEQYGATDRLITEATDRLITEATDRLITQKTEHGHGILIDLKHTTMWFWPELLIDTLEHMVQDNLPVSS